MNQIDIERLTAIINELTDLNIALGQLLKGGGDYPGALLVLQKATDSRLADVMNTLPESASPMGSTNGQAASVSVN